ncbi:MAG: AAA family ATPase [Paludibacteraceae bacterium]|nr:AAA family ATPase [Paludibacteraceae bacterium]
MAATIIGREQEKRELDILMHSSKAEFIAVYGRRRVGKTFLISEYLKDNIVFYTSGLINENTAAQHKAFRMSMEDYGYPTQSATWLDLFHDLQKMLTLKLNQTSEPCVVFLDEIPCMDTPKSDFIAALDRFWNTWASHQQNLKLIVCGSATSWIISNIIDSRGGLHNRLTYEIHLHPFTLEETERYFESRGFNWSRLVILQAYMAVGGIPYYLSLFQKTESVAQTLDRIYFKPNSILSREYDRLMASLFNSPEPYKQVIDTLSQNLQGMTRGEIMQKTHISTGGRLSRILSDLQNCDFIRFYNQRGNSIRTKAGFYAITDLFALFHHYFSKHTKKAENFFMNHINNPMLNTWEGLAFEHVVMLHIQQIKQSLGFGSIAVEYYAWRSKTTQPAVQIDLILDRADRIVNVCEIKYSRNKYMIDAEEYRKVKSRIQTFLAETNIKSGLHLTFITPDGLIENEYASEVTSQVKLDDLFLPSKR